MQWGLHHAFITQPFPVELRKCDPKPGNPLSAVPTSTRNCIYHFWSTVFHPAWLYAIWVTIFKDHVLTMSKTPRVCEG